MDETPNDLRLLALVADELEKMRVVLERIQAREERIDEIVKERSEALWEGFLRKHPELRDAGH
jgi:hypothetical protein